MFAASLLLSDADVSRIRMSEWLSDRLYSHEVETIFKLRNGFDSIDVALKMKLLSKLDRKIAERKERLCN